MNAQAILSRFKPLGYAATAYGRRALARAGLAPARPPVGLVIERADWAIRWWGSFTADEANRIRPGTAWVTTDASELTSGIVEFGSQYQWVAWGRYLSSRCRFVTTFFMENLRMVRRSLDTLRLSWLQSRALAKSLRPPD